MRPALALATILILTVPAHSSQIEPPSVFGTIPSSSIGHWIKYLVLGPQNKPFPIVWLSPQRFKVYDFFEFLTVLPRQKYDVVANFTEARMAQPDCDNRESGPPPQFTLQISKRTPTNTRLCVIPQRAACAYLSAVLGLRTIDWTADERRPIDTLMSSIKCTNH